ncbi:MAG: A/G-specific adenine glycosylase [Gammaproteobacteria bacterium]|nr:A/G-specific adenine glycosylase [Gammaproteobacteria bacterium]
MAIEVPADRFADRVLSWQAEHGRHDLPWQNPRTPYRVWVSEVMLQQTQVATVIPYFERFVAALPDPAALAAVDDDTLHALWSGLGYYRRARHLQRAARIVRDVHGGAVPDDLDALLALPGIGRSTAGAILSLGHDIPAPLLDGNVRRLFCRHFAIPGWPGLSRVERRLWQIAERHLPGHDAAAYGQGLMDLGALVCRPRQPDCTACPLAESCLARLEGLVDRLPEPRPRRSNPHRQTRMLLLVDRHGRLHLERRPPTGVWGGLHAPPECAHDADPEAWCADHGLVVRGRVETWPDVRHAFSHFRLDITPVVLPVAPDPTRVKEPGEGNWYKPDEALDLGLPAPVRRLIERLSRRE